jgi:hypothetical protein
MSLHFPPGGSLDPTLKGIFPILFPFNERLSRTQLRNLLEWICAVEFGKFLRLSVFGSLWPMRSACRSEFPSASPIALAVIVPL